MKKARLLEIVREEISSALNEIPDFGGQLDKGVSQKYGEEDTLQSAVDAIVDETLADMGVTLEDLKKDETKATEALTSIREKVLGAKRKGISQDSRVKDALEKQQDIEVDTLGGISGKELQQNQTNNAIKKALGLIKPGKQGRKASKKKEETPKAEPKSKESKLDDEDEEVAAATKSAGSDETAKELGATPEDKKEKFNLGLKFIKKYSDDKAKIDAYLKKAKEEYKLTKAMLDDLKRAAGRNVE